MKQGTAGHRTREQQVRIPVSWEVWYEENLPMCQGGGAASLLLLPDDFLIPELVGDQE